MAGQIKKMIDSYTAQMSQGDPIRMGLIQSKLCIQGIIPKRFDESSPDDPVIMEKLRTIARQANINL